MTFKATIKEIDNGFIVEVTPKPFEYHELYLSTLDSCIGLITAKYAESHPSVTLATPLKVPEKAPKKPSLKEPSEAAIRYTKLCGIMLKNYTDFPTQFLASFPGENAQEALAAANCKLVDGQVVFVGA
ncbi:MAG: hypothetical protein ABSA81_01690 [Candidatus Bathyarchaeia archaeon]|jgi:hypothetical protein